MITLRPITGDDLPTLGGGESPFDEFGPRVPRSEVPSAHLREAGGLAICDASDGTVRGNVSWRWQQWGPTAESRNPRIGSWLWPAARGHGVGADAQHALVDLFVRHTTVNRVEAGTDVSNVAEQRALTKAGFTREGTTRGAQRRDGSYRDCYLYSVLRHEWPPS